MSLTSIDGSTRQDQSMREAAAGRGWPAGRSAGRRPPESAAAGEPGEPAQPRLVGLAHRVTAQDRLHRPGPMPTDHFDPDQLAVIAEIDDGALLDLPGGGRAAIIEIDVEGVGLFVLDNVHAPSVQEFRNSGQMGIFLLSRAPWGGPRGQLAFLDRHGGGGVERELLSRTPRVVERLRAKGGLGAGDGVGEPGFDEGQQDDAYRVAQRL